MSVVSIGIILLIVLAILFVLVRTRKKPGDGPRCGGCGYNLTGCTENRCPECGGRFIDVGVDVPRPASDLRRRLLLPLIAAAVLIVLGAVFSTFFAIAAAQRERAAAMAAQAQARAAARQAEAIAQFQAQLLQGISTSQMATADEVGSAIDEARRRTSAATQPTTDSVDDR